MPNEQSEDDELKLAKIDGIDQSGFPVLRTHVLFNTKLMLLDDLTPTTKQKSIMTIIGIIKKLM